MTKARNAPQPETPVQERSTHRRLPWQKSCHRTLRPSASVPAVPGGVLALALLDVPPRELVGEPLEALEPAVVRGVAVVRLLGVVERAGQVVEEPVAEDLAPPPRRPRCAEPSLDRVGLVVRSG